MSDASRNKIQLPGYDPTDIHGTFSNKVHETLKIVSPDQHGRKFSASSLRKITELEFIRWRATVFGTHGQRILSAIRERTVTPNDTTTVRAPSGKFCSNTSCPMKSRYQAATCKTLWRKCQKDCVICNGRTHVCLHLDCIKIIEDHATSSR